MAADAGTVLHRSELEAKPDNGGRCTGNQSTDRFEQQAAFALLNAVLLMLQFFTEDRLHRLIGLAIVLCFEAGQLCKEMMSDDRFHRCRTGHDARPSHQRGDQPQTKPTDAAKPETLTASDTSGLQNAAENLQMLFFMAEKVFQCRHQLGGEQSGDHDLRPVDVDGAKLSGMVDLHDLAGDTNRLKRIGH